MQASITSREEWLLPSRSELSPGQAIRGCHAGARANAPVVRRSGHDELVDELWLNEGFASYLGAWAMDRYMPELQSGLDTLAGAGR